MGARKRNQAKFLQPHPDESRAVWPIGRARRVDRLDDPEAGDRPAPTDDKRPRGRPQRIDARLLGGGKLV
jgi:hypothetical protein